MMHKTDSTFRSKDQCKQALETVMRQVDIKTRIQHDPIRFPKRYIKLQDQELVAFLSALLAYGRVSAIGDCLENILAPLGDSPSQLAIDDAKQRKQGLIPPPRFPNFVYRFTREADLNKLWFGLGELFIKYDSLGDCMRVHDRDGEATLLKAYQGLYDELCLLSQSLKAGRGFNHLLSDPRKGSALKRINMFLRWMVRGPDQVDLGLWSDLKSARLLIPLDVHVFRLSQALGLTTKRTAHLKTVLDITTTLQSFDPQDPIKYDFALAHLGISGACKGYRIEKICVDCPLEPLCALD